MIAPCIELTSCDFKDLTQLGIVQDNVITLCEEVGGRLIDIGCQYVYITPIIAN